MICRVSKFVLVPGVTLVISPELSPSVLVWNLFQRLKTVCCATAEKSEVETPEGHAACSVIYAYSACAKG